MRIKTVANFLKGLITSIEDYSIPDGAASSLLNWRYKGDKIELRKGYKVLGTEQSGSGKVTGLHVAYKADGTQVLFRKRGRKLEYYSTATSDWVEVGTNIFAAADSSNYATFTNYASLAGNQMLICAPNSGPFKIMVANPGDYSDQYSSTKNFKGYIKIKQNRCFLWQRTKSGSTEQNDYTGAYGSYIDNAQYTSVSGEATTSLSGTLAFKAGGSKRTCFAVQITITATGEVYTDDYNGVLTGSLGGTGTINYMTGAYTLSNAGVGTANYQWEDSTNQGVMDFSKSTPRTAGQGFVFRQDDGGSPIMNVESYGDVEYCLHKKLTYALTLTATDTSATNLIYRQNVGIPNELASVATGDGIYYVDDFDQTDPKFRLLTINNISTQVIPLPVSDELNLQDYRFDQAVTYEWGEFVVFACRHKDVTNNNTLFMYNKRLKLWEKHDYFVYCLAVYNGALVAGESISENVVELFSGFDDNTATIPNYWEGNLSKLDLENLKRVKKFWVQGEISKDQVLKIYASFDRSAYVLLGTQEGNDDNVDSAPRTVIGSDVIGQSTLGGQTSTSVYNYIKEIRLIQGKFREVKIKFECTSIGYCSVSSYTFNDILTYVNKLPTRYRA
ncbi:MAG: hypothetical protein AB1757_06790 [Acidobacteriota bacterium]